MSKSLLHIIKHQNDDDQRYYEHLVEAEAVNAGLVYQKEQYPIYALRSILAKTSERVFVVLGRLRELGIDKPKHEDEIELVRLYELSQSQNLPVLEALLRYLHEHSSMGKYSWILAGILFFNLN